MNQFTSLSIKGFRRLQSIDLEMRSLMVVIGANGSGKTSLLDALSVLSASARGQLQETLQRKGGLQQVLTRGKAECLEIRLAKAVAQDNDLNYHLSLVPKGFAYEVLEESLSQHRDPQRTEPFKYIESHRLNIKYSSPEQSGLLRPNWDHDPLETSLAQVPKMYQEPESLRKNLASCTYYGPLETAENSPVRLPQAMRPASLPGSKGESLVSCLYNLRETDRETFEHIEDTLAAAFPDFERLSFPPVAAGTLSMTWTDRNFSQPIYIQGKRI